MHHPSGLAAGSLGAIIGQFKAVTAKRINRLRAASGEAVWQRNYYEHIIREGRSLEKFQAYIHKNPAQWAMDQLHPDVPSRW